MCNETSFLFGESFKIERGVTQGDIISPSIFNIVIDVIIRAIKKDIGSEDTLSIFYEDDGLITGTDLKEVQK